MARAGPMLCPSSRAGTGGIAELLLLASDRETSLSVKLKEWFMHTDALATRMEQDCTISQSANPMIGFCATGPFHMHPTQGFASPSWHNRTLSVD